MRCETHPCLSLIELLLEEQFKKEPAPASIDAAKINFFYLTKYFVLLRREDVDRAYYFKRVRAHVAELDNYLTTGVWKRIHD